LWVLRVLWVLEVSGMKSGKLTDVQIRSFKPGPKLQKYADGGGLCLVVTPAGGKNWWILYRLALH